METIDPSDPSPLLSNLETKKTEEKVKKVTFDDVLAELGEFGLEQKINYFLFSLPYILTSMQLMGWVFVGANFPHRCRVPGDEPETWIQGSGLNSSFSEYNSDWESNSCSRRILGNTSLEECTEGFVYHVSQGAGRGSSVTVDWNLVCSREGMKATVGAAPMAGYLVGGLIFGVLTDKFGRKPTYFIANILMAGGGILAALAPEFVSFVSARILTGFAIAGIEASCFVMGMELVGPSKRTLAGILCWFFETTGLLCTVALAYLLQENWRLLQVVYSAPALLCLVYWWIAPESVRWLVARGRNEEARKLIYKAANRNKVTIDESLIHEMELSIKHELGEERTEKTYTAVDLFRYPVLRWKTLILILCWVTCASLYYVLLLDQSELSEDKYIGFLMTAAVQLPGYVYVIFTLERPAFGRKNSMCMFLILAGTALFTHPFIPETYPRLKILISIIGRFAANCSYTILNLFSAEQFPTVVRGVGMGFCVVVSRLGTMLAPYLLLLGRYSPCLFGVSALVSGLTALLLPETLGQPMPETLQDGEELTLSLPFKKTR
ncbi:organic cation transporter protein [Eurytemora carolleeae]|uniref:organic cation transporter protein n=1 Tax=Eurytemora carolleeae TaxID=1294199 RepID=UPI000C795122|nr:organic cation transporter protein [Eurytemora carolleeae]|eukprot:XP_023320714.1 organic cation transporter protein-like [Eurytemora affinis]